MVVVSIISILATISVVAFEEAKYAAYRAQAKSTLGDIAQCEIVFFNEFQGYSPRLDQIGYNAMGMMYYSAGFKQLFGGFVYTGTPAPGNDTCIMTCGVWDDSFRGNPSPNCTPSMNYRCHPAAATGQDGSYAASAMTQNSFRAEAHGHPNTKVAGDANIGSIADTWTIDQNKNLRQLANPD